MIAVLVELARPSGNAGAFIMFVTYSFAVYSFGRYMQSRAELKQYQQDAARMRAENAERWRRLQDELALNEAIALKRRRRFLDIVHEDEPWQH